MKSNDQKKIRTPNSYFTTRWKVFWSVLAVVVILAIVLPTSILFSRKKNTPPPKTGQPAASVLVPLYVYPNPGAWNPLYDAIKAHPAVTFIVVVNPSNGPGPDPLPDKKYMREIPRLNAHANVKTLGYVSTNYAQRQPDEISRDISVYSAWADHDLKMHGIFFDETPTLYNNASVEVLEDVIREVRVAAGLGPNPLIIQNPGAIPDSRYLPLCNMTVVFEGTYATYQTYKIGKTVESITSCSDCKREDLAMIIHTLPSTFSQMNETSLIQDATKLAGSIFVTGLSVDYYHSFWRGWKSFVGLLDS